MAETDCLVSQQAGGEDNRIGLEKTFKSIRHLLDGSDFFQDSQWEQRTENKRCVVSQISFRDLVSTNRCFDGSKNSFEGFSDKQQRIIEEAFSMLTEGACDEDNKEDDDFFSNERPSVLPSCSKRDTPKIQDALQQPKSPSETAFKVEQQQQQFVREDVLGRQLEITDRNRRAAPQKGWSGKQEDMMKTMGTGSDHTIKRRGGNFEASLNDRLTRSMSTGSEHHNIVEGEPLVSPLEGAAQRRLTIRRGGADHLEASTHAAKTKAPEPKFVGVTSKTTSRRKVGSCPETPRATKVEGADLRLSFHTPKSAKDASNNNKNTPNRSSVHTPRRPSITGSSNSNALKSSSHTPRYTRGSSFDTTPNKSARVSSLAETLNGKNSRRGPLDISNSNRRRFSSMSNEKPQSRRRSMSSDGAVEITTDRQRSRSRSNSRSRSRSRSKSISRNGLTSSCRKNSEELSKSHKRSMSNDSAIDIATDRRRSRSNSRSRSRSRSRSKSISCNGRTSSGSKSSDEQPKVHKRSMSSDGAVEIATDRQRTRSNSRSRSRSRSRSKSRVLNRTAGKNRRHSVSSGGATEIATVNRSKSRTRAGKRTQKEETPTAAEMEHGWKRNGGDAELMLPPVTMHALLPSKEEMINNRSWDGNQSSSDDMDIPVPPRRSLNRAQGKRCLSLERGLNRRLERADGKRCLSLENEEQDCATQ